MPLPTPLRSPIYNPARLLALCVCVPLLASAEAPRASVTTHTVAGLRQSAEILVDRWGVAHIYAASQDDVFFVQGYNAARDRLFQIDLWRRRGLGRLAEVFGAAFVEQDRASRLFLYRGDMQKEWQAYGPRAQGIAERFVAGINAYIDEVTATPTGLPWEFRRFAYTPEKWRAQDVVRIRSHALTRNLTSEVTRSYLACHADLKTDALRVTLAPPWETAVPQGLDPCLPKDLLRVFQLATQGVTLNKTDLSTAPHDPSYEAPAEGSNAWVVAPVKSATGRPILASDPHRAYSAPSLRYITHLSAPQLDVIGAGEPALPGVSIGHNGHIAFGLTIFSIDQEDLYVYGLNPANTGQYQYQGQREPFTVLREVIAVKGGKPVDTELRFTRHGPVIHTEPGKNRAFAVRSAWFEPGMAPYFGSIHYMYATNFQEFQRAMADWGAPSENQVYADTKGNIGWVVGGRAPIRPNWDGLMPVPGDGRHEWAGFLAGTQLPSSYNPPQGWFASANEMNLPPNYPYRERKLGFEWASADRYQRLAEVLAKPGKLSIEDSMRLQNDVVSTPARRLLTLLAKLQSTDAKAQAALNLLRTWDGTVTTDSGAAALFEVWWSRYLGYVFKETVLSKAGAAILATTDQTLLLDALEKPETVFGSEPKAKRDWVLLTSLNLAWSNTEKMLGSDPRQWQWGKLHHTLVTHPFAGAVDTATAAKLNVGPIPTPGSGSTPNQAGYDPRNFRQTGGPSFRIVVDVGNWDNSRAINMPGQSGDPDSPHYRDMTEMWRKGEYFSLLYSRKKVEAATVKRIVLQPK
ncbi:MAG: penicillin acylase family protein [Pseudomonadota bacterium]